MAEIPILPVEKLQQVKIPVDYDYLRFNFKALQGLSNDQIIAKFKDAGIALPKDHFEFNLPVKTLDERIAADEKKEKDKYDKIIKERKLLESKPLTQSVGEFKNWAWTVELNPVNYKNPINEKQLQQILLDSAGKPLEKIGVMGAGHSWENIFTEENQVLIKLALFFPFKGEIFRKVQKNVETTSMTISAGCSIACKHLESKLYYGSDDFVLPSNVIYTDVQFVGVASAGCHGCNFNGGSVSDHVVNIVLYNAKGEKVVINKENEELPVAVINLGTLGIIPEMEFQMEPEKRVVTERHIWSMSEMMYQLEHRGEDWISYEVYWLPFGGITSEQAIECIINNKLVNNYPKNDQYYCQIVRNRRTITRYDKHAKQYTHKDPEPKPENNAPDISLRDILEVLAPWLRKYLLNKFDLTKIGEIIGKYTPLIQLIIQKLLIALVALSNEFGPIPTSVYNSIHYLPFVEALPILAHDIELGFTCGKGGPDDFSNIEAAFDTLEKEIRNRAINGEFPVNIIVEGRIVGRSICPLSPAYSTDEDILFMYLECLSFIGTPGWYDFSNAYFRGVQVIDSNVKPHLGKEWTHIINIYQHLRDVAGEGVEKLRKLQVKYDPEHKFMSPALKPLFLPD